MIEQLLITNLFDFATYVLGVLVFFSAGLLFWDSWKIDQTKNTPLFRSIGFFLLSIVYIYYAGFQQTGFIEVFFQFIKLSAFALLLLSILKEPILHKPTNIVTAFTLPIFMLFHQIFVILSAIIIFVTFIWYLRRATEGLEKQLKPAVFAFLLLAVAETIRILFFWSNTSNIFWSKILATHALVWNIHIGLQLIAIIILGIWVWGYIRFRIQIQLFITILTSIFTVFLIVTALFSLLLIKNIEKDALSHLETDARVFQYALERLQFESLSHAKGVAGDSAFRNALASNNKIELSAITTEYLVSQNSTFLVSISKTGEVLMKAEDKDAIGETLIDDALVRSALSNKPLSTLITNETPIGAKVYIKSAVPVYELNSKSIIGVVLTGFAVNNTFVDGIKDVTNLDATVFASNKRVATTIVAVDGTSRYIGTLESNKAIVDKVLEGDESYIGSSQVLGEPYYASYSPLKAYGGQTIGMLFIGRPQVELLDTAQKSINFSFLGSIILMLLAIFPTYLISRFIDENIKA